MERRKVYVTVNADHKADGSCRPKSIRMADNMLYEIDKILQVCRAASMVGGKGIRYTVKIGPLNARLEAIHSAERTESEKEEEVARLLSTLDELKNCGTEYNDNAVRQMIECIKVYPDGKLEIIFGGGYTITEQVEVLR